MQAQVTYSGPIQGLYNAGVWPVGSLVTRINETWIKIPQISWKRIWNRYWFMMTICILLCFAMRNLWCYGWFFFILHVCQHAYVTSLTQTIFSPISTPINNGYLYWINTSRLRWTCMSIDWDLVTQICFSRSSFLQVACSWPIPCSNDYLSIEPQEQLQWKRNRNTNNFCHQKVFENSVSQISPVWLRPQ